MTGTALDGSKGHGQGRDIDKYVQIDDAVSIADKKVPRPETLKLEL